MEVKIRRRLSLSIISRLPRLLGVRVRRKVVSLLLLLGIGINGKIVSPLLRLRLRVGRILRIISPRRLRLRDSLGVCPRGGLGVRVSLRSGLLLRIHVSLRSALLLGVQVNLRNGLLLRIHVDLRNALLRVHISLRNALLLRIHVSLRNRLLRSIHINLRNALRSPRNVRPGSGRPLGVIRVRVNLGSALLLRNSWSVAIREISLGGLLRRISIIPRPLIELKVIAVTITSRNSVRSPIRGGIRTVFRAFRLHRSQRQRHRHQHQCRQKRQDLPRLFHETSSLSKVKFWGNTAPHKLHSRIAHRPLHSFWFLL
jgi:hypothetical protein